VCDYEGPAVELVHAFKRQGSRHLTGFMAQALAEAVATQLASLSPEGSTGPTRVGLVPVPSRTDSFRRRGFVPSQLLAAAVATRLRSAHAVEASVANLARLTRKVQDQALLSLQGRQANLSGAMSAVPCPATIDAEKRRVVLIDDVVTTGATLNELHRAVSESGWEPLFFATFSETL
jgi:predicted amidophosphoribosyltransferase